MSTRWRWAGIAAVLLSLACRSAAPPPAPPPPVPTPVPPEVTEVELPPEPVIVQQQQMPSISNALILQSRSVSVSLLHDEAKVCAKCKVVDVFYATDRGLTGDYSRGSRVFGTSRSKVRYGVARVSIPPWGPHQMGGVEKPSLVRLEMKWDPNQHVMLLDVSLDAEPHWRKRLARAVTKSNHEALVFIHGFNVRFIDAARRTAQMSHDLDFDGVPVMFTWPSQGELSKGAYKADQQAADASVDNLKRFLVSLAATPGIGKIHIVAHSMGNRLLTQALAAIARDPAIGVKPRFNQVALTAPDIDSDVMARLASAITPLAARVTLYASSKDKALLFAVTVNSSPRAGLCVPRILVVQGIDSVDASAVDTNLVGHFYYAENRSVLSDIFHLIRGQPLPRFGVTRSSDGKSWLFTP